MSKTPKQFTEETRQGAVKKVLDGQSISETAKELGCHISTIQGWMKTYRTGTKPAEQTSPTAILNDVDRQELNDLHHKLDVARRDIAHLADLAACIAKNLAATARHATR